MLHSVILIYVYNNSIEEICFFVTWSLQNYLELIMSDIESIIATLSKFTEERDWDQFHNPKDLALAISIEANELLELFLWKKAEDADIDKVKDELADVFAYAFLLANKYQLDVKQIILDKIDKNVKKYPVEKSKGTAKKYSEL